MHDVNTRGQYDRRDTWDTPTLIECWRTGPYLHDGRYTTMKEVFSQGNHGEASDKLTDVESQPFGSRGMTKDFPAIREQLADGIARGDVKVANAKLDDILIALLKGA